MANNAASSLRYWDGDDEDLKAYFGIGEEYPLSPYQDGKDFLPAILRHAEPKQLVETENHPGFVPVKMGEDGKRPITREVERMLVGAPNWIFRQAEQYIRQQRSEVVATYYTYRRMRALPYTTKDNIARAVGLQDDSGLDRRLKSFREAMAKYAMAVANNWEPGTDLYECLQTGS